MAKYVLMQEQKAEGEYSSQIIIIDNSGIIGKKRVEALIDCGWKHVGSIESELNVRQLQVGFYHDMRKQVEARDELLFEVGKMVGWYN